ncbi:MAG: RNB domain-containing ribonuclease [Desulfosudaceae bacterium]
MTLGAAADSFSGMKKGTIVEYIDKQRLICAVLLEPVVSEGGRLKLYTENNREMSLPPRRVTYAGGYLDPLLSRKALADALKETAARRGSLAASINIPELWDLLRSEENWVSLRVIKELCFAGETTPDHEAAVVRAMFADPLYFKFDHTRFLPRTEEQIAVIAAKKEKEEWEEQVVRDGARWLRTAAGGGTAEEAPAAAVEILKRYYVFEKEAEDYKLARDMLARAGGISREEVFSLLARLGIWDKHENLDFYRYNIPTDWSDEVRASAAALPSFALDSAFRDNRRDLTGLSVFTIDGSGTTDYDDALSLEEEEDGHCRVGIHISDVAHFIAKDSLLDEVALSRGSSIYTPDRTVPMLPPELSEGACSLQAGEPRPALSAFIRFSRFGEILAYEFCQSVIRVDRHLTYTGVDQLLDQDRSLARLHALAVRLQDRRIHDGATPITIPDMNIQLAGKNGVALHRVDRPSPARLLVAEMMIVANRLAADFLRDNDMPAVFRAQQETRQRVVKKQELPGTLFQNWVQRKMMSRVKLGTEPRRHAGLGVERYVTVTSPIRKYLDLVTQRQLKAALGTGQPYAAGEIMALVEALTQRLWQVGRIQQARQRYWILKFLEARVGSTEEALILDCYKNEYAVLLPEYLLECRMSRISGAKLKPQDQIRVTIQHVNAFNNAISIYPA